MNKVKIFSSEKRFKKNEKLIKETLQEAFQKFGLENVFVEVYLVDNYFIRKLNKVFRKKNKSTNILTFPAFNFPRPDEKLKFLGEIFLAPDFIRKKKQDLKSLVIHGFLHLLGYTHKRKNDRIKMERLEAWLS